MKPKKKRVVYLVEPPEDSIYACDKYGLITMFRFSNKNKAKQFGKPVKFIEA